MDGASKAKGVRVEIVMFTKNGGLIEQNIRVTFVTTYLNMNQYY